jgi:hypothetical protein
MKVNESNPLWEHSLPTDNHPKNKKAVGFVLPTASNEKRMINQSMGRPPPLK